MNAQVVAYWTTVALSSFSLGAACFWVMLNYRVRPWLSVLMIGYVLTNGTLLWLVLPSRSIDPSIYFWLYVVGLSLAGIGLLGDLRRSIRINVERIGHENGDEL